MIALVALLIEPAAAHGAYVGEFHGREQDGSTVVTLDYNGQPDQANDLSLRVDGSDYLFIDDAAQIDAGKACSQESDNAAAARPFGATPK